MTEPDDRQLLAEFARANSDSAFAALVSRHLNLVYSVALRSTGNVHAAQEISQAVFIILARKAKSLAGDGCLKRWLRRPRRSEVEATPRRQDEERGRRGVAATSLSGWLYQTTRLTAANFLRGEIRRQQREQEAYMQSTLTEPDANVWPQIAPLLDDALGKLGERDRNVIVLRFFENKSLQEVGAGLGASEDAAKMRVNRALEKLRKIFAKRGVTLSATLIAGAVSANSVQAAPVGLAVTVTAAAAKGAAVSGSTLTLIKGALKIMAWTKAKLAIVVGVGVLLAAGTTTVVVKKISHQNLSETDLSWADDPKYWATDSRVLEKLSPVMIIRPTRFANGGGAVSTGQRYMAKNYPVEALLETAYGFDSTRTIFPENMPSNSYDLMYTLPAPYSTVLPQEIAKRFGYVAHKEIRQADVLLLKVQNPNPPNLKPSVNRFSSRIFTEADKTVIENEDLSTICGQVEGMIRKPVLDRTGLKGKYDITLEMKWNWLKPSKELLDRTLLDQLGLELVPSREPIEMLVVEKTN